MPKMKGCLEEEVPLLYPLEFGEGEDKKIVKKFTIREMTGYDEEELSQDQYRTNPPLWLRRLIWRHLVDAEGYTMTMDDTYAIKSPDMDILLVKLRVLSLGDEVDIDYTCTCGNKSRAISKLSDLTFNAPKDTKSAVSFKLVPSYKKETETGIVEFKDGTLNLVTDGHFQEAMYKKFSGKNANNMGTIKTHLLLNMVTFNGGVSLTEKDFKSMTQRQRNFLTKQVEDHKVGYDFKDNVSCSKCGKKVEFIISPFDFFD